MAASAVWAGRGGVRHGEEFDGRYTVGQTLIQQGRVSRGSLGRVGQGRQWAGRDVQCS
jgi:hypothetical protein